MIDMIVAWVCEAIAELFEHLTNIFSNIFGFDVTTFNRTFAFAGEAYTIMQSSALALALILAAWQILTFFIRGAEHAAVTPWRAVLNAVIAIGFIYYGNYLFELIMQFCQYPYDELMNANAAGRPLGTYCSGLVKGITDALSGTSMIAYLVLMIMLIFNFIKLLLEIVERYLVAFILMYLSPLSSAALASSATSGIYKKYVTMFISQCILIFLNLWCLKMTCSGMEFSAQNGQSLLVSFLMVVAFLRIASKMDSYLNQLGLNAAINGSGLGTELVATGAMLMRAGSKGGGGGSGSEGGNRILGAAKTAQTWSNRVSPLAAGGKAIIDSVVGGVKGGAEAFRSGGNFFKGVGKGMKQGFKNSDNLISNAATSGKIRSAITKAVNAAQGDAGPVEYAPGYRERLNQELVNGVPITPLPEDCGMSDEDRAAATLENTAIATQREQDNIDAWSTNQNLAHSGFKYVSETSGATVQAPERVAAIAQGLGIGNHSRETADMINVGFGSADGVANREFKLDQNGMHGEYTTQDGYRHKLDVYNGRQYTQLSQAQRQNLDRITTADGHNYWVRTSKTKMDDAGQKKGSNNPADKPADKNRDDREN